MAFVAAVPAAEAAGARVGASAAARRAAAKRAAGKKAAASRPITSGMTAEEVGEELQQRRRAAAEAKDARAEQRELQDDDDDEPASPAGTADTSRRRLLDRVEPAQSGAGFVLGLMGWVVFRAYVEGGMPRVRALLAAKFLNKTGG